MKTRRSTATLSLVLIGASALHGCGGSGGDDKAATRDVYRTRADCQRDWGDDPQKCEQQRSGSHSGMYYGPMMYGRTGSGASNTTMAPRKGSSAIGSTSVSSGGSSTSRGGFGTSASSHSSGG